VIPSFVNTRKIREKNLDFPRAAISRGYANLLLFFLQYLKRHIVSVTSCRSGLDQNLYSRQGGCSYLRCVMAVTYVMKLHLTEARFFFF